MSKLVFKPSTGKILRYAILITIVAVSFLFSPRPASDKDYCGQYISLGNHAGFVFNCDAADYCMAAKTPSRILGDSAVRQSRPLFILLASATGHPIQWLTNKLNLPLFNRMGEEAGMYIGFYLGYIILNFLTILLSLLLFDSIATYISGGHVNKWVLLALQLVLVSNEVTKAFFWTAHQQFFSFLTPLLTIWLALKITVTGKNLRNIDWLSLACGILMLAYGNFITMFATLLIVAYLVDNKLHFLHSIKNIALFLLPTALWVAYCTYLNGHYYNHEVEKYRQIVWIADTMSDSFTTFLVASQDNMIAFFHTFEEIVLILLPAVAACIYLYRKNIRGGQASSYLKALAITAAVSSLFFMALGFYEERLTYTLLPVCLCMICHAIARAKWLQKHTAVYLLAALAWHIYHVFSYGPFS